MGVSVAIPGGLTATRVFGSWPEKPVQRSAQGIATSYTRLHGARANFGSAIEIRALWLAERVGFELRAGIENA